MSHKTAKLEKKVEHAKKKRMQNKSEKPSGWALYRRLLWDVRSMMGLLVISVIGSILYSASDSYSIYLLKPILDQWPKGGVDATDTIFQYLPFIIIGLLAVRGLGAFLSSYFMGRLSATIVMNYRMKVFNKFLTLPASYYDKRTTGQLLSKMLYNVDQITSATSSALITIFQDGAFAIGLLVVLFVTSWKLSLFILIAAPFLAVFITWVSKQFRRLSKNTQKAMGSVTHVAEETIKSYREIRVFGGQQYQSRHFYKHAYYTFTQQLKVRLIDSISSPLIQMVGAVILALIIYLAIDVDKSHQWLSAGAFAAFISAMLALLKPVKNLTNVNSTIQKALAAVEDLYELIDTDNELDKGTKTLSKVKGEVVFENVSFNYETEDSKQVLKHISFSIAAGKTVALVGPSGGGKSTLVSLIPRFYNPTQGKILIDGVNINELTLENLRTHISFVSQHVCLFDDTLFHNIAYGKNMNATETEVINAAKSAQALEFIQRLPAKLGTVVGENGMNLSGGQRQRVAIARAILKDAPILILDEATSALDNESERLVQKALDELKAGRTTFVIAHRLSTIETADEIIVINEGEIVERGTHQDLLGKNGLYAQLHAQAERSNELV
ncbi:lipid A export permease/ATP-binding protein MsbA [Thiotrichales bacterium 19S3-7]|nr:lipid A export permease/ATP-binding protein MsbA [Thiotrichales bacterium 19S3-7]MCF6801594.1 lipid A export permease/ATP-binding protein MsbA [Thiotrichales bacterium 19S3-11]